MMATTAMAGALTVVVAGPQPSAHLTNSVLLASAESPLQPVVDQILSEMQAAMAKDSALPYATSDNNAQLPTFMQNLEFELLEILLQQASGTNQGITYTTPEAVAGDATDPRAYPGFFNADTIYSVPIHLDPDATYQITGTVGQGTGDLVFTANASGFGSAVPGPSLELDHGLVVNPDGSFTIDIGPTKPSGAVNFIDDTGFSGELTIRDKMANVNLSPTSLSMTCISDCPAPNPGITDTGLSSTEISTTLQTLVAATTPFNEFNITQEADLAGINLPKNTMAPFGNEDVGGGFPGQFTAMGNFNLQPDQALIIKVPTQDAGYSSIQLNNVFGATLPGTLAQTTLNNTQTFHDPDGYTYYVVSATNPGVANWLDNGGLSSGSIIDRLENMAPGVNPDGVTLSTQVVPVTDVSKYLPADTPTVSPEQFAADMIQRMLGLDSMLDSSRTSNWVTQQLWLQDIQSAMGADNFEKVFGSEPSTPMWLRLTPALSPDLLTVLKDVLTDPSAAMSAIRENLALAEKDIALPIQLAEELFQKDPSSLLSVVNEALFDPNTSITAGILNARDDLANAVMAAVKDGFPTEAGPIATWEWGHMSELTDFFTS
ncbi:hypothetical protein [[Mycobacterium] vasticus]|uniref:DUF1214 domain-containing protein n=1 Tax=[Mycobacterium] vasticus TaxID=2875777 RepID=A0ABU5YVS6_9MYCO|nr:hypothetical protein [Mycolicibacter sp. MYC017]MEB3069220.1 hypothetical protein [Mycolicibacter sp. MYC017]